MEIQDIIETQKRIIDTISLGVNDAIIITDPERKVTNFNRAAEEVTGYSVVDVINHKLEEVLRLYDHSGEADIDKICPIGELEIQGVVYENENMRLVRKDEDESIVNIRSVKIKGGTETNLGCIIFLENTFEQSELERMKLDFVSMAEHVLRTPITIIRGYISRLLEERTTSKLDDTEINYLNQAFLGTSDLLSLVEDLLNITGFRKGLVKVNPTGIDIEGLVSKVVSEFKLVAADKGLQIVFIPPIYKLPLVKADISKIKIVIQNLIENAIKYTKEGKIEIVLINKEHEVEVQVKDTGKGIPQEYIEQLFSKFYRVKKALEMDYGMGLGLYISKKVVDAHHGRIWVDSEEGKGSTFHFTLPVVEEES
jgi:PAS domain S-box-containing protein